LALDARARARYAAEKARQGIRALALMQLLDVARAQHAVGTEDSLVVDLVDGRTISIPIDRCPRPLFGRAGGSLLSACVLPVGEEENIGMHGPGDVHVILVG
jgi:hypothetical protein